MGLVVEVEVRAHRGWHRRLRDAIQGESRESLDVPTVASAERCALGHWLVGPGQQAYGKRLEAQRRLLSTFAQRSAELVAALDELGQSAGSAGPAPDLVWDDFTG